MTCDVCKSNHATVFLTQIVSGQMKKINLCEACSKEKGVMDPTSFALTDLLGGLGAEEKIASGPGQKCPACGFTQADFKKTGRLGCPACYETFGEALGSLLKAMHKGTSHAGKIPSRQWRSLQFDTRLKTLRKDLQRAVKEENYESAASLRDQIKQLESEAPQADKP
jgi:protein arginine kinase activator